MEESTQTNQPDQSAIRDAARHLYETTPATFDQVGEDVGVSGRTVKRWSAADGGWVKAGGPALSSAALEAADRIQTAVADITDEEDRQQVLAELRETAAVDQRAAIIARHRAEVSGPRALAYEGMRKKDMDLIRMAKTAAEALKVTQDLERRAWNIVDASDAERGNTVVVIERN